MDKKGRIWSFKWKWTIVDGTDRQYQLLPQLLENTEEVTVGLRLDIPQLHTKIQKASRFPDGSLSDEVASQRSSLCNQGLTGSCNKCQHLYVRESVGS